MKILFIGTVEFSLNALEKLIDIQADVVGVCTKKSSNFNSDYADLTPICNNNNIPYQFVNDINSEDNISWIKKLNPDIIFCFGWSALIKEQLLNLPKLGIIGYHPAQLPYNRGRHPIIWALALGLKKSASTFFFMKKNADDGDILSQKEFQILFKDNAKSLYSKVTKIALKQIEIFVPQLEAESFIKIKQNHSISNTWRKRSARDGIIDFRMSSIAIYNLVRGLTKPYIGASIFYKEVEIKIWRVEIIELNNSENIEYGKILDVQNDIITIKTYDNAIKIIEHNFINLPKIGEYL